MDTLYCSHGLADIGLIDIFDSDLASALDELEKRVSAQERWRAMSAK